MKKYDEIILGRLLGKYEESSLYDGSNTKTIRIIQKIEKEDFPEYYEESSMEYQDIHAQLQHIEEKGLIKLYWKNKRVEGILEKCELETGCIEAAYKYLKRKPKSEKVANAINVCKKLLENANHNEICSHFLEHLLCRLEDNKSISQYMDIDDTEQFIKLFQLLDSVVNNTEELFLREFSIKIAGDSKLVEKDIAYICSAIRRFSGVEYMKELNDEEILREFKILRNPVYIHIKGFARLCIETEALNLGCFNDGIGISGSDAEKILWNRNYAPKVIITVENLTSFHQLKEGCYGNQALCIYLGGYHNSVLDSFLSNLHSAFPESDYYHFGDIDCGGFMIWKNLVEKTGIMFKPLYMDEDTYLDCIKNGKELSENDKRTLNKMKKDPFFHNQRELFSLMLETGLKTEQESVDTKHNEFNHWGSV